MFITRKSIASGKTRIKDLDVTQEQIDELSDPNGRLIQLIVPNLTKADREFLQTGMTQGEWDTLFGGEEDA